MLPIILILSAFVLVIAYRFYGRFLSQRCQLDDSRPTPAKSNNDGVDFVPTHHAMLFGHHFSSIAGAGPIVGPILATMYFGWGPTLIWILLGAIFVGGVHDFGSTLMSIRNQGRTISQVTKDLISPRTAKFFRIFLFLALVYVIIVFLDLTATTFVSSPAVATASGWFIAFALLFGLALRMMRLPIWATLLFFVPVTFAGLWVGHLFPAGGPSKEFWILAIVIYCFVAAVLPVNVLLQPRDFLSSMFLYVMMGLGVVGLLFSGEAMQVPVFHGFTTDHVNPGYLFPVLFITVACGACSGFHSMVSSGTTSKQIKRESDTRRVAYGSMLVEGLLAVFALATIAILSESDVQGKSPVAIFSIGAAVFMKTLGIPQELGMEFTALTVSTFLLTTLDTCTRLARFLIEEFFEWRNESSRYAGTFIVLLIPAVFAFQTFNGLPAWKAIWPLFGATNQLMAALALVTFVVYLKHNAVRYRFALIPAAFMLVTPLVALGFMVIDSELGLTLQGISLAMLVLGLYVSGMSLKFVFNPNTLTAPASP
ncbi:carbon starvation protein A [Rubellicoccus peritrichatus]|uniref:Carbon starvation protein A n=1 Tax=Rubellicoccus peritrichatus TaxID=3080537 RepID=A0AAQ3LCD7_9BACT|nr:carbon starvation protein A [Puniceicoccus sp. CR14]WOO40963.1 carbon starvation protein A [Puniceicoccus sp. CR14]